MISNYLDKLPDELYIKILKYIFYPPKELQRYDNEKQQWNPNLFINRCYLCKQLSGSVSLSFNCNCNSNNCDNDILNYTFDNNCQDGCDDQLICWSCFHN